MEKNGILKKYVALSESGILNRNMFTLSESEIFKECIKVLMAGMF